DAFWGVPYDFTTRIQRNRRTFTQDLRFESPGADTDRPFAWIAGAYVRELDESDDQLDRGVYLTDVTFNPLQSDSRSGSVRKGTTHAMRIRTTSISPQPMKCSAGI